MAEHDYYIDNAQGKAVRDDLNLCLDAIATNNAGSSAPGTPHAYQWWADTSSDKLKMRNANNNAWIPVLVLSTGVPVSGGGGGGGSGKYEFIAGSVNTSAWVSSVEFNALSGVNFTDYDFYELRYDRILVQDPQPQSGVEQRLRVKVGTGSGSAPTYYPNVSQLYKSRIDSRASGGGGANIMYSEQYYNTNSGFDLHTPHDPGSWHASGKCILGGLKSGYYTHWNIQSIGWMTNVSVQGDPTEPFYGVGGGSIFPETAGGDTAETVGIKMIEG